VTLVQHSLAHNTPDAVFPNNWFSTHTASESDGATARNTLVLYPMKCANRANERRPELVELLKSRNYDHVYDMTAMEADDVHFEGTGALVLDRVHGTAFVALSERADRAAAEEWVDKLGYKTLVTFTSVGQDLFPVYHTNVMMAVGTSVAIVCGESIPDDDERRHLWVRCFASSHDLSRLFVGDGSQQMAAYFPEFVQRCPFCAALWQCLRIQLAFVSIWAC
jgi:hypothetical protein